MADDAKPNIRKGMPLTRTIAQIRPIALALVAALFVTGALGAQNLIPNGDFDDSVDGWTFWVGQQIGWTDDYDEAECAGSGVAVVQSAPSGGGHRAELVRCVPIEPVSKLSLRMRFATEGRLAYGFDFYATTNCTSTIIGGLAGELNPDALGWKTGTVSVVVPPASRSMAVFASSWAPGEHLMGADSFFASVDEPIFADGFEGDTAGSSSPCRWCAGCA